MKLHMVGRDRRRKEGFEESLDKWNRGGGGGGRLRKGKYKDARFATTA